MLASETVRRFLKRAPQHEIHRPAHEFLGLACHLQKFSRRDRRRLVQRHEQVHITAGSRLPARSRAEHVQPADAMLTQIQEAQIVFLINVLFE